jgi:hypothetical protein
MSLPIHGRVVHGICTALAKLDEGGTTVTPGVTPLAERGSPRTAGTRGAPRTSTATDATDATEHLGR